METIHCMLILQSETDRGLNPVSSPSKISSSSHLIRVKSTSIKCPQNLVTDTTFKCPLGPLATPRLSYGGQLGGAGVSWCPRASVYHSSRPPAACRSQNSVCEGWLPLLIDAHIMLNPKCLGRNRRESPTFWQPNMLEFIGI